MKINRLFYLIAIMAYASSCVNSGSNGEGPAIERQNLAVIADPSSSNRFGREITWMNDGLTPVEVNEQMRRYRQRRREASQWVQYSWNQPVTSDMISLFLWDNDGLLPLPQKYAVKYWDGNEFKEVQNPAGLAMENGKYNITTFDRITTTILRIEADSAIYLPLNVLEWIVYKTDDSPLTTPVVDAGIDRSVMVGGKTYLSAKVRSISPVSNVSWKKISGPGRVEIADVSSLETTATFTEPGTYTLRLTAREGKKKDYSDLMVRVVTPPPAKRLDVVYTKNYSIDNELWNDRAKALIVNWIPHCIEEIERTDLTVGEGGLDNFIEAAKALRGEPHAKHKGYVFSNAWVHQTIESMCIALMVDPKGDPEIISAQELMKKTIEKWIPIILSAQEPDGYLQTAYTLRDTARWQNRWEVRNRSSHEGYVAGYFIESAINHYTLTDGTDTRLYDAAKKLADCWVANIGPGKIEWYDGHQEMEQALVRFGRFVNDMEGNGRGDSYISLAKFLLDNRAGGSEYDQSHLPVQQQYEAVGHAVRAVYNYSAMADVAAETGDIEYQSAVMSLWDNMVNRKYYVTGGIGSGETSEGFGGDYSLPHNAYCESCSSCGLIFFEYKMNLAYHDGKYADLYEETMYNALLGSIDLEGNNFTYTNPMITSHSRYGWHVCPCCVGNIPRTLLMVPTWTYVKGDNGLYVNLYIGSTINVENVAGMNVEMVQKTEYPWDGKVSLTVNPAESKEFTIYVRVPDRNTSELYSHEPDVNGINSLAVNGKEWPVEIENGYTAIKRIWEKGDQVSFELPLEIQVITPSDKIAATKGEIALRYGPLIYNVEEADNSNINQPISDGPLVIEWRPDLLNGVMTIKGTWADGSPLLAIPNYARGNRDTDPSEEIFGVSKVWIDKN